MEINESAKSLMLQCMHQTVIRGVWKKYQWEANFSMRVLS